MYYERERCACLSVCVLVFLHLWGPNIPVIPIRYKDEHNPPVRIYSRFIFWRCMVEFWPLVVPWSSFSPTKWEWVPILFRFVVMYLVLYFFPIVFVKMLVIWLPVCFADWDVSNFKRHALGPCSIYSYIIEEGCPCEFVEPSVRTIQWTYGCFQTDFSTPSQLDFLDCISCLTCTRPNTPPPTQHLLLFNTG